MVSTRRESTPDRLANASDEALARLELSITRFAAVLERKYNFDPDQPRYPSGMPLGGRWRRVPGGRVRIDFDDDEFDRALRKGSEAVDGFLFKHRRTITRALGGLDMLLGAGESVVGIRLAGIGAATSETGVGVPLALVASWMTFHGHDTSAAGWRAWLTGFPQETSTYKLLRDLGLNEQQAANAELVLALPSGAAVTKLTARALDRAAKRELLRRAARAYDSRTALRVEFQGRSLWDEPNIRDRGDAWEVFDAKRTGYQRTPNAPTFDQIGDRGRVVVSNKNIDIQKDTYIRALRKALLGKMREYIYKAATQTPRDPSTKLPLVPKERRVHLLLRFGDSLFGQELQIVAAEEYAKELGVILKIDYAY